MENRNERKIKLLESVGRLIRAIDNEIDWYIASFKEKDPKRRLLARNFFSQKRNERIKIAKEEYERYRK